MTRRIFSVALIALGVVAIALAIASATVWRPDDQATLSLPARPEAPVVLSEPGVLEAVDPQVTIRAVADDDQPVTLAVGRTSDVVAWVADAPHAAITGLTSWQQLAVETRDDAAEEATEEPTEAVEEPTEAAEEPTEAAEEPTEAADPAVPAPAGSDLWVAEQTGTGQVELDWEHPDGRWSLLAVTDGTAPAPEISLTWPVESRTPWLVPGLVVGAVLLVAGLALLVLDAMVAREAGRRRSVGADRAEAQARSDASETDVLTAVGAPGAALSPRELRERAEERRSQHGGAESTATDAADEGGESVEQAGPARGAGEIPAATDAQRDRDVAAEDDRDRREGELGAWFGREGAGSRQVEQVDTDQLEQVGTDQTDDPAAATPAGEENGSTLERAAEQFEESAATEDHPPAERVDAPHSLLPEDRTTEEAGPRERTGLLGFLRRRRREPGVLASDEAAGSVTDSAPQEAAGPAPQPGNADAEPGTTGRPDDADDEKGDRR